MSWNDKRPMSPHLQIYKLPLSGYLSISHRITGIINCLAILLLVWVLAAASGAPGGYASVSAIVNSWFGYLVLFGFTLTLYYHLCNGIRHLFWDVGKGFELSTVDKSGKASIAATIALTLITWIVASAS